MATDTRTTERFCALRNQMAAIEVDLLVLGPGSHMRWLLDFAPHADERPCLLFISRKSEAFLMPALNAEDVAAQTDIMLYRWHDGDGPSKALTHVLADVDAASAKTVAIDETLRADHALLALDALPGVQRRFAHAALGPLRITKDAEEHSGLMASARINDTAMQTAFDLVQPGTTERQIAAAVHRLYLDHGATPAFDIIGSGANGSYPHHETSNRALAAGDPVVIDIGGIYNGYPSDMTRMAVAGEPSTEYLKLHQIVENAVTAALAAARPGVEARVVDTAARDVIEEAGYGQYFTTRTGHGLGLDLHEMPYLSTTAETILTPGMVFSIEPGIYIPGQMGIRLEEVVYLGDNGPEIFSALPRDAYRANT
ncbi:M24 family metallopeptidase [Salinisphaera orenii]|uniref:M24 family metallopeptidase n=1 Tax=Salinisphaera orenii TaxID=856731 RepID=UPI000DBE72A9